MSTRAGFSAVTCALAGLGLSVFSVPVVSADTTQNNLVVQVVVPGDGGIYVGFTTLPTACIGAYRSAHAFLRKDAPSFDAAYAFLAVAQATGQPIRIAYSGGGGCTSADTVLRLTSVQ
jgi:hypothetical protein